MAYVDAIYDPEHDKIHVAERVNGKRELLILLTGLPNTLVYLPTGSS